MNKSQRLWLLAPLLLAACKGEETGFTAPNIGPIAYVRYVHAMPDTGLVVVRWTDKVENWVGTPTAGTALGVGYRHVTPFQGVSAGQRTFKVWPATTNIALTQDEIATGTVTLEPNTYYTVLHTGYARCNTANPAQTLVLIEETHPTPAAGQFSVRTIVAAPGLGAQDAYVTETDADPLPATPHWNLTYTQDAAALATIPWVGVDTGTAVIRLYNDGNTATTNVSSTVPAGARATTATQSSVSDLPGTRISGSGLTAFVFPQALTTACATTGTNQAAYGIDVRPPVPQ
jgi:hypothetical protein